MNKINKNDIKEIKILIAWSTEDLKSAERDISDGYYRSAISRSYYAAFDLTRALLLTRGVIAKTHRGLANQFSKIIVKDEKLISDKHSKWLYSAVGKRQKADYDVRKHFSKSEANEIFQSAKEFIEEIKKYLKSAEN